jgi:response regulator NasT
MADKPLRILVIDANSIRASIIEDGLREAGYQSVIVLTDATAAMRRIVEIDPT